LCFSFFIFLEMFSLYHNISGQVKGTAGNKTFSMMVRYRERELFYSIKATFRL
jgi:hypothetical protein